MPGSDSAQPDANWWRFSVEEGPRGEKIQDDVTHQLIELVFKQAIFDLGVIAATLQRLLEQQDPAFGGLVAALGAYRTARDCAAAAQVDRLQGQV